MSNTFIHLPPTGSNTITGPIDVNVSASNDSIKISDGTDILGINADGSINVTGSLNISDGVDILDINPDGSINIAGSVSGNVDAVIIGINEYTFNEVTIAAGATTTVISQLFPTEYKLRRVRGSGENIGVYFLKFDGAGVDKIRTTYTDFNSLMDYETGILIPAGVTVNVDITNASNEPAVYSAQILYSAR